MAESTFREILAGTVPLLSLLPVSDERNSEVSGNVSIVHPEWTPYKVKQPKAHLAKIKAMAALRREVRYTTGGLLARIAFDSPNGEKSSVGSASSGVARALGLLAPSAGTKRSIRERERDVSAQAEKEAASTARQPKRARTAPSSYEAAIAAAAAAKASGGRVVVQVREADKGTTAATSSTSTSTSATSATSPPPSSSSSSLDARRGSTGDDATASAAPEHSLATDTLRVSSLLASGTTPLSTGGRATIGTTVSSSALTSIVGASGAAGVSLDQVRKSLSRPSSKKGGAATSAAAVAGRRPSKARLLGDAEAERRLLESLKGSEAGAAAEEERAWRRSLGAAAGAKVRDDPTQLRKQLKKAASSKAKSAAAWAEREAAAAKVVEARQSRREANLGARRDAKRASREAKAKKKGKGRPGFEGKESS